MEIKFIKSTVIKIEEGGIVFRLIQFEIIKVFKSTFFRLLMLGFLLLLVMYYIYIYINTTRLEDITQSLEATIKTTESYIQQIEDQLKESNDESESSALRSDLEFWQEWLEKDKHKLALYEQDNWNELMQLEIISGEELIGKLEYVNQTHTYTYPTHFSAKTFVERSKWMQEKEVTPILPLDLYSWMTYYDQEISSVEGMEPEDAIELQEERSTEYSSTGVHFIYHFFNLLFGIAGAVFFLFLFGDVVTKEGLGRNGPIYLLRTQPIHRDNILIGKFITVMLLTVLILFGSVVISLLMGSIFDRIGDWEYPVLVYGEDRSFTLIGMGTYLIKASGLFFMLLLFCYSILFLFSVITRRVLIALGLTLVILYVGIRIGSEVAISGIAQYIPFQYFSVSKILTNELALSIENFQISFASGMVSLGISSLILILVTYIISVVQAKFGN